MRKIILFITLNFFVTSIFSQVAVTTLISPPSGSIQYADVSITFSWTSASGATSYDFEFDAGQSYAYLFNITSTNTTWTHSAVGIGPHTWHVRGRDGTTIGAWSSTRTYSVVGVPSTPTLSSPGISGSLEYGISTSFSWDASSNAVSYQIQFDSDSPISVSGTSYLRSFTTLGNHIWKVQAINPAGVSGWSSSRSVTVSLGTPSLTAPSNNSVQYIGVTFNFMWSAVADATSYDFEFDTGQSYAYLTQVTGTSMQWVHQIADRGPHTWHVRSKNGTNLSAWSPTISYNVEGGIPSVTTLSATSITSRSANLNGNINPNGISTSYYFQYGTTTSYGSYTPTLSAGSGTSSVDVNYLSDYLSAGTTYHYCLVATSSGGTSYGSDMTITTDPLSISMSAPSSNTTVIQGQNVTIMWSGSPSTGSVSLRRDNDNIWENGTGETWIAVGQASSGSFLWNTSSILPGTYYIAVMISDGNSTQFSYAAGTVTINNSPYISSFTPTSGPIGTSVTITGTNFSTTPANNIVWFGAVKAIVTAATVTQLTVTVPTGTTYQPISVTTLTNGLTASSNVPFTVTFPSSQIIDAATFASKVNFLTGTGTQFVAIDDIDGDGKPDLVSANNTLNTISALRNTSTSGSITIGSFSPMVDFNTGLNPGNVAFGDIDGDGKQDMVVSNWNSKTISIFRNISAIGSFTSGTFESRIDFPAGGGVSGVAIRDIDGDGKQDIVVTNEMDNTVSVFRNTCTQGLINSGSFSPRVNFVAVMPCKVSISDIDGDGKPDLVVANAGSNSVSVFRNTSIYGTIDAGSFAAKVDFTTGNNAYGVAVGDIDGDGKPDLAVISYSNNTISVLRNTSSTSTIDASSFAAKVDYPTGSYPEDIQIGDINGDGKPDLVSANWQLSTVSVLQNNSKAGTIVAGSFGNHIDFGTGTNPNSVAIGDVDGDGKPDLAVGNFGSNNISVFRNTISVGPPTISSFNPTSGPIGTSVTISGSHFSTITSNNIVWFGAVKAAVTAATPTSLTVTVPTGATYQPLSVTNTLNGLTGFSNAPFIVTFPSSHIIDAGAFATSVDFVSTQDHYNAVYGDIDGDGKPDLAVVNYQSNTISVYRNTSTSGSITTGSFATPVDFIAGTGPYNIAIGDIDGDGKLDLVVANWTSNTVSIFRNTSSYGSITSSSFSAKVDLITGTNPSDVAIGDLDGDGKPELTVTSYGSNIVSVFKNNCVPNDPNFGIGSFAARVDFTTEAGPARVVTRDFDGDNKPDLAVTNYDNNSVSIFRNIITTGSFDSVSFATRVNISVGTNPYAIAVGDLDGDGKPDIAVTNTSDNTISALRNISTPGSLTTGSFATRADFIAGASPQGIALGDIDGDGKPDIAVTSYSTTSGSVSIFRNISTSGSITSGSFNNKVDFATQPGSWGINIGDIDGDGKPDIVVANTNGKSLSILRNTLASSAAPTAPIIGPVNQPTCTVSTGSTTLSGLPATGTWTLTRSPGSVITTGTGTTKIISGLVSGTYNYTVTNSSGVTSGSSADILINAAPVTTSAPTIGIITQPSCSVATGSAELKDMPSSGTWTITISPGGATFTGVGIFYVLSGISAGTYSYTVTNASGCISPASANVIINTQPATPTAPVVGTITQPTCSLLTGSVTLSGLPSTGTWTLTKFPGGTTTTGTGTSSIVSGLATGTFTFTVTDGISTCTSVASGSVVVNAQPATPTAPTIGIITQPTCSISTGSAELKDMPSSGTWTVTISPGGATFTGVSIFYVLSGISSGTYRYTVTNASGCNSTASANVIINTQPITPTPPVVGTITQPTCSLLAGSVILNGLPSTGTWTLTRTPGGTTSGSGTSISIPGLAPGTYSFTVTNSSGCISAPTSNVIIQNVKIGVIPVITKKWDDVLICYNLNNELTTWQWFKGITPLTDEITDPFYWARNQSGIYKVLTTDKEGCKNYSNTIQIGSGTKSLNAYPNPASENITLSLNDDTNGKAVISIYNQSGTKVMEVVTEKEHPDLLKEIAVSSLAEGIYLVKVTVNQVNVYYTKIMVAK